MRKLVLCLHSSLDGYVEGPHGAMDIDWIAYNEELEGFAQNVLSTADTILWGRGTYEMMYSYWPGMIDNPEASEHEASHAQWITDVEKKICSTQLSEVTWSNASLLNDDIITLIEKLKEQPGQDIVILGSPRLAHFLMEHELIDAYKISVSPVILGDGLKLFKGVPQQQQLKLISSETFSTGALALSYEVIK